MSLNCNRNTAKEKLWVKVFKDNDELSPHLMQCVQFLSAMCEQTIDHGFSLMNLSKTKRHSRMGSVLLNFLMVIRWAKFLKEQYICIKLFENFKIVKNL